MKLLDCTCVEEFMQWSIANENTGTGQKYNLCDAMLAEGSAFYDQAAAFDAWFTKNIDWLIVHIQMQYSSDRIAFYIAGYYWHYRDSEPLYHIIRDKLRTI